MTLLATGTIARARSVVALSVALLMLCACRGTTVAPVAQLPSVAQPGERLAPIELDRIVFNLERGQEIGTYRGGQNYTGCGTSLMPTPIQWWTGRVTVADTELTDLFAQEMHRAGYNVVGNAGQLFADVEGGGSDAEFLIGGRVDSVLMDVCDEIDFWGGRRSGTQSGEIAMDVTWQVFSLLERRVVLETRSRGSAVLQDGVPDGEVVLLLRGLAAAAANLAADRQFHQVLQRKPPTLPASAGSRTDLPLPIATIPGFAGGIGTNMTRIQDSVVTIRSGTGQGSGFFIAPKLILTNQHVVGNSGRHKILLIGGDEVYAETLRSHAGRDVALLMVEGGSYPALPLRRDPARLTEEVYAVGSPLDESLAGTVTRGIVSQVKADSYGYRRIQADVSIQPGSSGGPLLDADGTVIGLSQSGLVSGSDHSIGINFFVPIDDALRHLNIVVE